MSKRTMSDFKKSDTKHLLQTKIYFGIITNTHQSIRSYCKDRIDKCVLIKQTICYSQRVLRRPYKYLEVDNCVSKTVNNQWKMGILMTINLLQTQVLWHVKPHIQEPNYKLFSKFYNVDYKKNEIFLKRSLEYCQLTNRCSSVSQKKST